VIDVHAVAVPVHAGVHKQPVCAVHVAFVVSVAHAAGDPPQLSQVQPDCAVHVAEVESAVHAVAVPVHVVHAPLLHAQPASAWHAALFPLCVEHNGGVPRQLNVQPWDVHDAALPVSVEHVVVGVPLHEPPTVHPAWFGQFATVKSEHAVGVPPQVQPHPVCAPHVACVLNVEHAFGVPPHDQLQPPCVPHVADVPYVEHAFAVPLQPHAHPVSAPHVADVVSVLHAVAVPTHWLDQVQPRTPVHVADVVSDAQLAALGVPAHEPVEDVVAGGSQPHGATHWLPFTW
jgi:hypothetical protein